MFLCSEFYVQDVIKKVHAAVIDEKKAIRFCTWDAKEACTMLFT